MFLLTKQQEQQRVDELSAEQSSVREKAKVLHYDSYCGQYRSLKEGRRTEIIQAALVAFGGLVASLYFLPSFLAGVGATLALGLGFFLSTSILKESDLVSKTNEIYNQRPEAQSALEDWLNLKRLVEDSDYGRAVWAEQNGLCNEGTRVGVKGDNVSEEVHLISCPWDGWAYMYEQEELRRQQAR